MKIGNRAGCSLLAVLLSICFGCKKDSNEIVVYDRIPRLYIETEDQKEIISRELYLNCSIRIDGTGLYEDFKSDFSEGAKIRGRGNSSWVYYDKKPYRFKLDKKAEILGMKPAKSWVLLANYRDPTNFMNAVAFDMARFMEMPYTNSNRFVEVFINGEYRGLYQLTEQVQQGENRVDVDDDSGLLLNLDLDDGPGLSPDETNNFYSSVFRIPVAVKHPEDPTSAQLEAIRQDFEELERLIANRDFSGLTRRLDVQTLIDFLILQELTRNVELVSPRSMYMFRDQDGIYKFGPVWDFDGGFAFDWASMSTGHGYFGSQSWLMGSKNPGTHPRDAYNYIPDFFVAMFENEEFVEAYQSRWNHVREGLLDYCFIKLDAYTFACDSAMSRNSTRWPIGKNYDREIERMKSWLSTRVNAYDDVVSQY